MELWTSSHGWEFLHRNILKNNFLKWTTRSCWKLHGYVVQDSGCNTEILYSETSIYRSQIIRFPGSVVQFVWSLSESYFNYGSRIYCFPGSILSFSDPRWKWWIEVSLYLVSFRNTLPKSAQNKIYDGIPYPACGMTLVWWESTHCPAALIMKLISSVLLSDQKYLCKFLADVHCRQQCLDSGSGKFEHIWQWNMCPFHICYSVLLFKQLVLRS
jgi:hypothetical protein